MDLEKVLKTACTTEEGRRLFSNINSEEQFWKILEELMASHESPTLKNAGVPINVALLGLIDAKSLTEIPEDRITELLTYGFFSALLLEAYAGVTYHYNDSKSSLTKQLIDERKGYIQHFFHENPDYHVLSYQHALTYYNQGISNNTTIEVNNILIVLLASFPSAYNESRTVNTAAGIIVRLIRYALDNSDTNLKMSKVILEDYCKYLPGSCIDQILAGFDSYLIFSDSNLRMLLVILLTHGRASHISLKKYHTIDFAMIYHGLFPLVFRGKYNTEKFAPQFLPSYFSETSTTNHTLSILSTNETVNFSIEDRRQSLKFTEKDILSISLLKDSVLLAYDQKEYQLPFFIDDYNLNQYSSSNCIRIIQKLGLRDVHIAAFSFSYLYLDGYRGIRHQCLDFEHRFVFETTDKSNSITEKKSVIPNGFYDKNIHTMTCIVGQNGTGKSSAVNFLRENFTEIRKYIDEQAQPRPLTKEDNQRFGLNEDTSFLIIFNLDEKSYYISNFSLSTDQKSLADYCLSVQNTEFFLMPKFLYFSGYTEVYSEHGDSSIGDYNSVDKRMNPSLSLSDYSEQRSNRLRINTLKEQLFDAYSNERSRRSETVNRDLLHQMIFLKYVPEDVIEKWLGRNIDINSSSNKSSQPSDSKTNHVRFSIQGSDIMNPFSKMGPFSSGEYAKFTLLSHLYWVFKGWKQYEKDILPQIRHDALISYREDSDKIFVDNIDRSVSVIDEGDTVVLFIDEGEVYYHPEWQRHFISDLIELVHFQKNATIQIIITTNSPFILSDLRAEDVIPLSKDGEVNLTTRTFGQNIHTLLSERFFMSSTIGAFAEERINWLYDILGNKHLTEGKDVELESFITSVFDRFPIYNLDTDSISDKTKTATEIVRTLISYIGEDIIRMDLEQLFSDFMIRNDLISEELDVLRQLIDRLEREGHESTDILSDSIKALEEAANRLQKLKRKNER